MGLSEEQFKRMTEAWNFSNLHLRYEWEDLTDVSEVVKQELRTYISDFTLKKSVVFERFKSGTPPGILLYSHQTGTAKTVLINLLAKELVLANKGIRKMLYLQGVEMFNELKRMFRPEGGLISSDLLEHIITSDVFFLDDFDKLLRWSPWEKEQGTLIIDKCYTSMKPLIITANRTFQEMAEHPQIKLEQHLLSRLSQMCKVIHIDTKQDFRLSQSKVSSLKIKKDRKFVI